MTKEELKEDFYECDESPIYYAHMDETEAKEEMGRFLTDDSYEGYTKEKALDVLMEDWKKNHTAYEKVKKLIWENRSLFNEIYKIAENDEEEVFNLFSSVLNW